MCDPVSAIAGAAGVAAGASAASDSGGGGEGQTKKEKVKKTEDKSRLKVLNPEPKQAQVRIGDTRSLRNLAAERKQVSGVYDKEIDTVQRRKTWTTGGGLFQPVQRHAKTVTENVEREKNTVNSLTIGRR